MELVELYYRGELLQILNNYTVSEVLQTANPLAIWTCAKTLHLFEAWSYIVEITDYLANSQNEDMAKLLIFIREMLSPQCDKDVLKQLKPICIDFATLIDWAVLPRNSDSINEFYTKYEEVSPWLIGQLRANIDINTGKFIDNDIRKKLNILQDYNFEEILPILLEFVEYYGNEKYEILMSLSKLLVGKTPADLLACIKAYADIKSHVLGKDVYVRELLNMANKIRLIAPNSESFKELVSESLSQKIIRIMLTLS
jgi:hypothetical protein